MNDKEYSFEEFFASGTGIESEKTETTSISFENFDGYFDGISLEMYQSNEDIEFLNSFEAVSRKNEQDKIMMLKKLKTNYNMKSIESYCDDQIQSFEFSKEESTGNTEKGKLGEKIKDKIIMVFKKIAEFVRHLFDVIVNMKYRGKTVEGIKAGLKLAHDSSMEMIKFASNKSDFSNEVREKIKIKQEVLETTRRHSLETLKCLNLAYKYAKKSGKTEDIKNMGEFIDSDVLEKVVPELRGVKTAALNDSLLRKTLSTLNIKLIFNEESINAVDKKDLEKTLSIYTEANKSLINLQENLKKKIEGLNNSKESLEQKDVKKK